MAHSSDHHIGFFPNLISVVVFVVIMAGMFFGFTRYYPELAQRYYERINTTPPPNTTVQDIAVFVRGTVSGVKTAEIVSKRQTAALDISSISGYKSGITTALLTSKNWYNLDRQLFRVRGIEIGMITALQMSKTTQARATLSYQVKLIQQLQTALSTNLEDLLQSNNESRERVLSNYLENLKTLSREANIEVENMTRTVEEAQGLYEQAISTSEQFSDSFVSDTSEFITDTIDTNLDLYLQARKQAEEQRVRVQSTGEILARLRPLAARVPQIIEAIEANFEALASGIKITPTPGVNLPLINTN